jgi:hypothetical protein
MTKSVVYVDIILEHKSQNSEQSISGLNHRQAGLIFNGGDPIRSLDQRISGGHDLRAEDMKKMYFNEELFQGVYS